MTGRPTESTERTSSVNHDPARLAERLASFGIVDADDPVLHRPAQQLRLPDEAALAVHVVGKLRVTADRLGMAYTFCKGLGLAAPKIGLDCAAAIVRPPGRPELVLLNARIVEATVDESTGYEGCLSFFDVRGLVARPKVIDVEHQGLDGTVHVSRFRSNTARLVAHEVDHLHGVLYTTHMPPDAATIPLSDYTEAGKPWPIVV